MIKLSPYYKEQYKKFKPIIDEKRLEYKSVKRENYFYELCFCICTPQSKAHNAFEVQKILQDRDFYNNPFDVAPILREPSNYIRFHNQKAIRLYDAREIYPVVLKILDSDISTYEKRNWLVKNVNGYGLKESSHFLRNIGYENLAILDRHILRHLTKCGVYDEIPKIKSPKHYLELEQDFIQFAKAVNVPLDELDLLFWGISVGEILK